MNYSDSEMIDRLLEASEKNDYKLRDLMTASLLTNHSQNDNIIPALAMEQRDVPNMC